jgi:hypothetical protein
MSTEWDDGRINLGLAVEAAERAVADVPDAHDAWVIANQAATAFREATARVVKLRGVAALRIKDQDKLSLRHLADKIGVSHVYAHQLITESEAHGDD